VIDLTKHQESETADGAWQVWLSSMSPLVTGLRRLKPQLPPLSSQTEISHVVQLQGKHILSVIQYIPVGTENCICYNIRWDMD
jgi:hypothetical protein